MFLVSTESLEVMRQCPARGRGRPPYDGQECLGVTSAEALFSITNGSSLLLTAFSLLKTALSLEEE